MLEHLQTYQQTLFDLTANYLEPLPSCYSRLAYLYGLFHSPSGKYVHEPLAVVYGAANVHVVIAKCHEEVFERLLEMPLNAQGEELRIYLSSLSGTAGKDSVICVQNAKKWVPPRAPGYLTELYCSNLDVLLELLRDDKSTVRPNN
jgi:hypothetical protein